MIMAAQPSTSSPFSFTDSTSFYTPSRKRRAASPETPAPSRPHSPQAASSPWTSNGHFSPEHTPQQQHREKRRRPNLAHGFESLSISRDQVPGLADPAGLNVNDREDNDEEGIGLKRSDHHDIHVEVLPDRSPKRKHHHHQTGHHHWSVPNHAGPSSSSSSASSEENYDSDATFTRAFPRRRYRGVAQQADEVVDPDAQGFDEQLGVEDVTACSPHGSRRRRDDDAASPWGKRPRREGEMDVDMGEDPFDKRGKRKTVWHEPEKDRIVITSLSDASSSRGSSRSPSPEFDGQDHGRRNLAQPGNQGFTISPSLLTHLLHAQRDQLNGVRPPRDQRSLVLYRPLGIPAAGQWPDSDAMANEPYVDSGRFEVLEDADVSGGNGHIAQDGDMDMDLDGDVEME
ncbi:hypothetical protein IAU60_006640 [Kwoniella sp. DSM 27419]